MLGKEVVSLEFPVPRLDSLPHWDFVLVLFCQIKQCHGGGKDMALLSHCCGLLGY